MAVACVAALWLGGTGVVRGTFAVGGSDSSCYALTAAAFARGQAGPFSGLALEAPWPDVTRTLAPGGFLPHDSRPGVAVPICAPGFAALLAPLVAVHRDAIFLLVPVAASALVLLVFVLARRLAGDLAGATASVLIALAPVAVFQAVQPLNDIVTAALWTAVAVAVTWPSPHRPLVAGLLTGCALLLRPNLLPAGAAAGLVVLVLESDAPGRWTWPAAARTTLRFAAGTLPGGLAVLALHAWVYGSPWRSGYGDMRALFAVTHVWANLAGHGRALLETQTAWVGLAVLAPFALRPEQRGAAWGLSALVITLVAGYLFYQPFSEWWYLRFLLPAVAVGVALAAASTVALGARAGLRGARLGAAVLLVTALVGVVEVRESRARGVYAVDRGEARFRHVADAARDRLPPDAVVFTVWSSGTLRYGTGHEIVMWDALEAAWLDRAIAWLQARGRPVAIVVEDWEAGSFRTRFAGQRYGALDWPPRLEVDRRVQVYRPDDREAYLAGRPVATEVIRPRP